MTFDDIKKVKWEISAEIEGRGFSGPPGSLNMDTIILVSADFSDSVNRLIIQKNNLVGILYVQAAGCLCFPVPWILGEDFEIRTRFSTRNLKFSDN